MLLQGVAMNLNDATTLPVNELGCVPRFGSADEAQAYLTQRGVKYVLAQFVDIHGVAKAKSVPVSHLKSVLTAGAGFAGFAIWGVGIEPNGPDYMAVGDLATLTPVPWQPGLARIVCDGHVNGEAWQYDSRVTLKKAVARMTERNWTLFTGLEPEFSLLRRSASRATTIRVSRARGSSWNSSPNRCAQ
jgi:glutamine synthetase